MLQPRTGGFACSGRAQVDRLRAFAHAVRLDVEGDLLAVDERAQARGLDRGDVDEHILGAAVRRDEAEAFGGVEELYGAGLGHWGNSFTRQSCWFAHWLAPQASSGGCFGSHAFAHSQTPRRKRGRQRFTLIGERSSKTCRSPGRKCPNTKFITRKRDGCKTASRAALGAPNAGASIDPAP